MFKIFNLFLIIYLQNLTTETSGLFQGSQSFREVSKILKILVFFLFFFHFTYILQVSFFKPEPKPEPCKAYFILPGISISKTNRICIPGIPKSSRPIQKSSISKDLRNTNTKAFLPKVEYSPYLYRLIRNDATTKSQTKPNQY